MSSYGRVKSMNWWVFSTPNAGTLIDLDTGIEYPFKRSAITQNVAKGPKWNVKKWDVVKFDIVNEEATNIVLFRKFRKGRQVN